MSKRLNVPLLIGIGLPTLVVVGVLLAVFVPRMLAPKPKHDILLVTGNSYGSPIFYAIENGKLVKKTRKADPGAIAAELYRYEVPDGGAEPIEFSEAAKLTLNRSTMSPDKYVFEAPGRDYGLFDLFGGRNLSQGRLRGHGTVWKLDAMPDNSGYGQDFEFLGWIIEK